MSESFIVLPGPGPITQIQFSLNHKASARSADGDIPSDGDCVNRRARGRQAGAANMKSGKPILRLNMTDPKCRRPVLSASRKGQDRIVVRAPIGLVALGGLLCLSMILGGCARARGTPAIATPPTPAADCCQDANSNGFPDQAELHSFDDRENFRQWFTWIAEMQFYQISEAWNQEQRDCAGLVRFAMREALRRHDRGWFQKMGPLQEQVAPDVDAYNLENGPLGEKLFRTDFGSFKAGDLAGGIFSEYADGRTLKNYNCTFIGRERTQARPGDLLFFYRPWVQHYPYHVMIFTGRARAGGDIGSDWVVYHTGSSASDAGTVKKVRLGVLDNHPDPRWRPVPTNRNFLGFYRLKILD